MPSWKKIIVSGSDAEFNNITASAGIDVSGNITGSNLSTASFGAFIGDGSQLSGLTSAAIETYTNSGNNRILTSVDSSTVNSEANLTFDGSTLEVIGSVSGSSISTGSFGLVELSSNSVANASLLKLNYGGIGSTSNHAVLSVNAQGSLRIMSKANNSVFEIGLYNNKQFQFEKHGASGGGGLKVYQSAGESNNFAQIKSTTPDVDTAAFSVNGYYNGSSGLGGDLGNGSSGTVSVIGKHVYLNNLGTGALEGKVGAGILPASASARLQVSATENYLTSSALFKATIGDNTTGLTDVFTITGDNKISGSAVSTGSFGKLLLSETSQTALAIGHDGTASDQDTVDIRSNDSSTSLRLVSNNDVNDFYDAVFRANYNDLNSVELEGPQGRVFLEYRHTGRKTLIGHSDGNTDVVSTTLSGSLVSTASFGKVVATTFEGSGASITDIPNSALTNDGITIAGQDISLGGSISADTIAGQISNDGISGNQINGGTIGSTTITTLSTTDVTVGGTLTVNGTLTYISSSNLRVQDNFAFLATGSAGTNVDAGIIAQSGSADLTGSALYHDTSDKRWSVATQVASNATAVTPLQYLTTVKVSDLEASLNANKTYTGSVDYGKGEMVVDADGEIFIYT